MPISRASLAVRAACGLAIWAGAQSCHSPADDPNSTVPGKCTDKAPSVAAQKTDILFVVDNSESMSDKQAAVARELPAFVQALQAGAGVQQDFQVGLVTTTVYQYVPYMGKNYYQAYPSQAGKLQPVPQTDGGLGERILAGSDPDLVAKFTRLVQVGINGSGQETPFEAARLATTVWANVPLAAGGNQGFLRDGAQVLIITVMDEDDCSELSDTVDAGWRPQVLVGIDKNRAPLYPDYCTQQGAKLTSVQTYFDIFQHLADSTGALRPVIWADIAPVSLADKSAASVEDADAGTLRNIDCPNSFGPGFRHAEMAAKFDSTLGDIDSICDPSYHTALVNIAARTVANQTIKVYNVPDPGLLVVKLTRANGSVDSCTVSNTQGFNISYEVAPNGDQIVQFRGNCLRRFDDLAVTVELLCAG